MVLNKLILISLFISVCFRSDTPVNKYSQKEQWKLVWHDEFNYKGLPDSSKWNFDTAGNAYDWGNQEAQFYTDKDTSNAYVDGKSLTITALRKNVGKKKYTSARLTSKNKGDWKYGKLEIRAKVPTGRGTWPAIWMLPTDEKFGGWPKSGEIDIMEYVGWNPDYLFGTVHTESFNHIKNTQRGDSVKVQGLDKAFHIFEVEWNQDSFKFEIDNKPFFTYKKEGNTSQEWPFDERFHLLLNLAIGGSWGGAKGIDDELFPHKFVIDYVRVYQKM